MRQTIAYVLRAAKKDYPDIISGSTTLEGRNYVWTKPPNPEAVGAKDSRTAINNHEQLVRFCNNTLKCDLKKYVSVWVH